MCKLAQKKNRKRNEDRPFSSPSFFALLCTSYTLAFFCHLARRRRIEGRANWVIQETEELGGKEVSFVHFDREKPYSTAVYRIVPQYYAGSSYSLSVGGCTN